MSADRLRTALAFSLPALLLTASVLATQQAEPQQPEKTALADGIDRLAGREATSRIQYVRLILSGSTPGAIPGDSSSPSSPPGLIAQCTLRPNGKSYFELFANFGSATDLAFYPPWTPTSKQDLFPPRTEKVTITMDFLGYTHVKPVRRQWEIPAETPG
jgi:hypothetical protein